VLAAAIMIGIIVCSSPAKQASKKSITILTTV
jgi:hypothetical protein